ncbi:hypothetical protein [Chamaesiphon minutus]|nr:hypothetical protein [Chamaesiphon minutus]
MTSVASSAFIRLWQLKIHDRAIDLAYTYVRSHHLIELRLRTYISSNS